MLGLYPIARTVEAISNMIHGLETVKNIHEAYYGKFYLSK